MSTVKPRLPECPHCAAPLELSAAKGGIVRCAYCNHEIALRSLTQLGVRAPAAPPSGTGAPRPPAARSAPARPAQPETVGGAVVSKIGQYVSIPFGALAAYTGVMIALVFWRAGSWEYGSPVPWAVLMAFCAIVLAARKRRAGAALLCLASGVAIFLKPFVRPAGIFSPTSESGMYYLVPGVLLAVLGLILFFTIRKAQFGEQIRLLLRPRIPVVLALAAGVGLGVWLNTGPTNADVIERYRAEFDAKAEILQRVAAAIEFRTNLPRTAGPLDPTPNWKEDARGNNVDVIPFEQLRDLNANAAKDLYLGGDFVGAMERVIGPRTDPYGGDDPGDWWLDPDLERELQAALAMRYLAVYLTAESTHERAPAVGIAVWLVDLEDGSVIAAARDYGKGSEYGSLRLLFCRTAREAFGGRWELD